MSVEQTALISEKQQDVSTALITKLLGAFLSRSNRLISTPQVELGRNHCWSEFSRLCVTKVKILSLEAGPFPASENFHSLCFSMGSRQFLGYIHIYILRDRESDRS